MLRFVISVVRPIVSCPAVASWIGIGGSNSKKPPSNVDIVTHLMN